MAVPFNTHEVIQELQELGFPTPQAEGLTAVLLRTAQASQEQLATKLDLAEVKAELESRHRHSAYRHGDTTGRTQSRDPGRQESAC